MVLSTGSCLLEFTEYVLSVQEDILRGVRTNQGCPFVAQVSLCAARSKRVKTTITKLKVWCCLHAPHQLLHSESPRPAARDCMTNVQATALPSRYWISILPLSIMPTLSFFSARQHWRQHQKQKRANWPFGMACENKAELTGRWQCNAVAYTVGVFTLDEVYVMFTPKLVVTPLVKPDYTHLHKSKQCKARSM